MRAWARQVSKKVYAARCDVMALLNRPDRGADVTKVYYGGARSGSLGGPLVKVSLLQREFPEVFRGFNLIYLLSGGLHLSSFALKTLHARGMPMILNQNGVFFPAWYPVGWQKRNDHLAAAVENASHVFYQSEFCKRAADRFLGVSARSSEILYNAVDTDVFKPKQDRNLSGRPLRLVLTGKIGNSTSSRLISSIAGLAAVRRGGLDAELHVYGAIDPAVLVAANALVTEKNLTRSVLFYGPYPHEEGPEIYRGADIYVMNKHNDSCPNVVLEALASGVPVLYSASGGTPELVGPDAGAGMDVEEDFTRDLVPAPAQFAEGVAQIVKQYDAMAQAARFRAIERFGLAHWIGRHRDIFMKLIQDQS